MKRLIEKRCFVAIGKKSVKWSTPTIEQAELWVQHLESTREVPNTLASMLTEWKKNKELVRCVGTSQKINFFHFPS